MTDIIPGLIITAIGMGLVFAAIVFLWGLMALMVYLDGRASPDKGEILVAPSIEAAKPVSSQIQKAAAAALAVALAQDESRESYLAPVNPELGRTWQSVQRAQVLQDKSRVFTHRPTRRS